MAAQRHHCTVWRYARTRSFADFRLDVSAMLHGWALPARLMFGDGGGSSGGGDPRRPAADGAIGRRDPRMPAWYRRKAGYKYHGHDLGPTDGESTRGRGDASEWDYSAAVLRQSWAGAASKFGGHGIAGRPIAAKYGTDPRMR